VNSDPIELVLTVRVELPDELVVLLRQLAMPSAAPTRADADKTWTEARKQALRRLWPEILDVVRRTSRRTRALLERAQIVAVDGDLVQLSAPAALARMIAEQSNAAALARALTDVVGGEWHVDVRAAEGEATRPDGAAQHDTGNGAGTPSPPPETDPREDAEQIDEAAASSASAVSAASASTTRNSRG